MDLLATVPVLLLLYIAATAMTVHITHHCSFRHGNWLILSRLLVKKVKEYFISYTMRKKNLRYFTPFNFISPVVTNVFIVYHHLLVLRWSLLVYAK